MSTIDTLANLERLWVANGGPPQVAATAAAIAMAESSGNPTSKNPNDPNGGSFGLWQINGAHAPNGDPGTQVQQLGTSWGQAMFDPNLNAAAAVSVSGRGTNFGPWSTYTNGAYRAYLAEAQQAQQGGALQGVAVGSTPAYVDTASGTGGGGATATNASVTSSLLGGILTGVLKPTGYFLMGAGGVLVVVVGGVALMQAWTKVPGKVATAAGGGAVSGLRMAARTTSKRAVTSRTISKKPPAKPKSNA